ncbi:phosphoribosylformylglycinamidine synthase subunit PurQ [bacterium]|nr:phosphoribosylformylglycinamidine synthase subunit PurQ [bacterium]
MKSIVLSSRIKLDKYNKINFLIDEDLANFINHLNVNIFPISFKKKKINFKNLDSAKGLILAGGGDIYEYKKTKENKIRDNYEKDLFNYFSEKNKPILLICRGFQLLAKLNNIKLTKIKNHVRKSHLLKLNKSKYVHCPALNVNSYHQYMVDRLPNDYTNIANTKDGSIEIAEHKNKKILCLMFHPERSMVSKNLILKYLKSFF